MKRIVPLLIVMCIGLAVKAQGIKELKVKTSYLEYPKIPVQGLDLNNIKAEFAHGQVKIGDKSVIKTANLCKPKGASIKDAKAMETFYYSIKYSSPDGIVTISNPDGKVVYAKKTDKKGSGTDEFGKSDCYFLEAILESAYKKLKSQSDSLIAETVYQSMYKRASDFVSSSVSFRYVPEEVEVHYLKSNKEFDYSELQKAAEKAVEGYTALNKDAFNEAGKQKLQEAIELWKKEVATTDIQNRKARINKRSAGRLYKNIGLAYAYLRDYKSARENIKSALKLYPSMSNNSTVYWEQLGERFYHQQKYYEMNKDAEVVLDQPKVNVENRGIAGYNDVRSGYQAFLGNEMSDQIATAKKEREEAIASGEENPYKTQMVHSATQGYMLMIPNLSSATLTSLADMKNAMKKLEEFPVEICELTQLNQLILKNNKIKTIPTDIGKLVNLTKLDLAKNQIASLPSELGELKKLKTLVLKGNPLTDGEVDKIQKLLPKCKIKI